MTTLFCIPYAGGSSCIYNKLKSYVCQNIKIRPLELAGKGYRFGDDLYADFDAMVDDVVCMISKELDSSEYAIFGHSMGGLVAFETVARICKMESIKKPSKLIISAFGAPNIKDPDLEKYKLDDESFINFIIEYGGMSDEVLNETDLLQAFLPSLRNDFKILNEYEYENKETIKIPTTILFSDEDNEDGEVMQWMQIIPHAKFHKIEGNHFYINTNVYAVANILNRIL